MGVIQLRCLGGLSVRGEDGRELRSISAQGKRLALLVYLLLAKPRGWHARETLVGLFWPDAAPDRARRALNQAVYVLRRGLGPHVIVTRGVDELSASPDHIRCDFLEFEAALDRGDWATALELYGGDLLKGLEPGDTVEFERWLELERARLRDAAIAAGLTYADGLEQAGEAFEAVFWTRQCCAWAPFDERPLRSLLSRLERAGDRSGAIREYEGFATRLRQELELDPAPETVELASRLRLGGSEAAPPQASHSQAAASSPAAPARGADEESAVVLPTATRPRRSALWLASAALLFVALGIGTGLVNRFSPARAASAGSDPPGSQSVLLDPAAAFESVLVTPLDNRTGESGLDRLGRDGLDRIIEEMARNRLQSIGLAPADPTMEAEPQAADPGGGVRPGDSPVRDRLVVRGSFARARDSLHLRAQIVADASGRIIHQIGPVSTHERDPMRGIEEVSRRVSGALAMLIDPRLTSWAPNTSIPSSYQGYQAFVDGLMLLTHRLEPPRGQGPERSAIERFQDAARLDSGFTQPLLWIAEAMTLLGRANVARADSLLLRLKASRHTLPAFEQAVLDALRDNIRYDYVGSLDAFRRALALAPGSDWMLTAAEVALQTNRPAEAAGFLLKGAAINGPIQASERYWWHLGVAYHALGKREAELDAARRVLALPPGNPADEYNAVLQEALALAAAGRLQDLMARYDAVGDKELWAFRDYHARELFAHGHDQAGAALIERVIDLAARATPSSAAPPEKIARRWGDVLTVAGRWTEARARYDVALAANPSDHGLRAARAYVAARSGDRETALRDRALLEDVEPWNGDISVAQPFARDYNLAIVAAGLGDVERALQHLRNARRLGGSFHAVPYFRDLRDNPEFQALIRPEG